MFFEDTALPLILKNEGVGYSQKGLIIDTGYVNDPQDSGGETNYGITQNSYDPSKQKKIKNISYGEVVAIYKRDYWELAKCDRISEVAPSLALNVFDCAVNCGTTLGIIKLQDVLGVDKDGVFGSKTLAAINEHDQKDLLSEYTRKRQWYYCHLVVMYPKNLKFLNGWILRTLKIHDECMKYVR